MPACHAELEEQYREKTSNEIEQLNQKLGRQDWTCCKSYVCSTCMLHLFMLKNGRRGSRGSVSLIALPHSSC